MVSHEGHRQRLRNRFLKEGLDNFEEINVLELLLFNAIPRKDTNELAHLLLDAFGNFEKVLDAPISELTKVKGISDNSATYLSMISAVCRYYMSKKGRSKGPLLNAAQYIERLSPEFIGRKNEMVYMLCLDSMRKEISCVLLGEGSVNGMNISTRKITERALAVNAQYVVLAHNHPNGLAVPSREDIAVTKGVADILEAIDVILLDHIIVTDSETVSMVNSGAYVVSRKVGI